MSEKLRVLTIGHSYVVALNQAVPAAIAQNPDVDVTVAAPSFHYGVFYGCKVRIRQAFQIPQSIGSPLILRAV